MAAPEDESWVRLRSRSKLTHSLYVSDLGRVKTHIILAGEGGPGYRVKFPSTPRGGYRPYFTKQALFEATFPGESMHPDATKERLVQCPLLPNGYLVSSKDGHIVVERYLTPRAVKDGNGRLSYLSVGNGTGRTWFGSGAVHHLVAEAFLGPRPDGYVVDHIDGNVKNNRAVNLRYVTTSHNLINKKRKPDYGIYPWPSKKEICKWKVQFKRNGRCFTTGYYKTIEEARAARDAKIAELDAQQEIEAPGSGYARG